MTTDIRTYNRTLHLTTYIQRHLDGIEHDFEKVEVDGAKKWTAVFKAKNQEQADLIAEHKFRWVWAEKSAAKSLDQKAMLAGLSVKGWAGRMFDKAVTEDTLMRYQADAEMGRFMKRLVSKDALKRIKAAEAEARRIHKEMTLPWDERGFRLLPAALWSDYAQDMNAARDEHADAVAEFLRQYETVIEDARHLLGGMFDPTDYPTAAEVEAKFSIDNEIKALDTKGDFRVELGDAEIERLQDQVKDQTEARLQHAMREVYGRLHDVIEHMADRLKAYQVNEDGTKANPFRDATLTNVQELVDLLPKLNVTGDPALDAIADEVRKNLLQADADTLRTDEETRQDVAAKAEEIVGAMANMM